MSGCKQGTQARKGEKGYLCARQEAPRHAETYRHPLTLKAVSSVCGWYAVMLVSPDTTTSRPLWSGARMWKIREQVAWERKWQQQQCRARVRVG